MISQSSSSLSTQISPSQQRKGGTKGGESEDEFIEEEEDDDEEGLIVNNGLIDGTRSNDFKKRRNRSINSGYQVNK